MVERILDMIGRGVGIDQLFISTFTVKAAGELKERLEKLLKLEVSQETAPSRIFDIPVCYGGEYGPDLENIAMHANLSTQEVIDIHSSEDYLIYMLGFLPDFLILGDWTNGSTHQDLQIRVLRFRQEASESAVPRGNLSARLPWRLAASGADSGKDL